MLAVLVNIKHSAAVKRNDTLLPPRASKSFNFFTYAVGLCSLRLWCVKCEFLFKDQPVHVGQFTKST